METLISYLTVFFGLALRLGLPVIFTALLIVLLRKLDARWQQEGTEQVPVLASNTRCWEQHHCSAEKRGICSAYAHPETPCWQVFRSREGFLREQCIGCETFRKAPVPANSLMEA